MRVGARFETLLHVATGLPISWSCETADIGKTFGVACSNGLDFHFIVTHHLTCAVETDVTALLQVSSEVTTRRRRSSTVGSMCARTQNIIDLKHTEWSMNFSKVGHDEVLPTEMGKECEK